MGGSTAFPQPPAHSAAPIGGTPFPATLRLYFWHGQLGEVIIFWDGDTFPSVTSWQGACDDLYEQLTRAYGKGHSNPPTDNGFVYDITDASGNTLSAYGSSEQFNIRLKYTTAAFEQAVKQAPKPAITY
jgi:hypothetical protein